MAIMQAHRTALIACVLAFAFIGFSSAFLPVSVPLRSLASPAAAFSTENGRLRLPSITSGYSRQVQRGVLQLRAAQADWGRSERVNFVGEMLVYSEEVEGAEVGVVQAKMPLTPEQPYFEITVEDGGTQSWIGCGLARNDYPLDRQPGWEQTSVGYHADDGMYYRSPVPDQMSKRPVPPALDP